MHALLPSPFRSPIAGIAGHIGVGHAFSHCGFMQEDSTGFATLLCILSKAYAMDFTIADVSVEGDTVHVVTKQGGHGQATAIHGFTPFERDMMRHALSKLCLAPQTLATQVFGRMYGQGVAKPAATFSLAVAKAYCDTVRSAWPESCVCLPEDITGCCGEFLGGTLSYGGHPMAWLLSVNASVGGVGPVEDAEGIIPVGNKGNVMQQLGMEHTPILVLESKAFVPQMADSITEDHFFARWNNDYDNPIVGECLAQALRQYGMPFKVQSNAYPRDDMLALETKRIGQKIADIGQEYRHTSSSAQKVALAAELAHIVSHDLGASIYMSHPVFQYAGGGGLWPGQGAVLSMLTTSAYAHTMGSMVVTPQELEQLADIALLTVSLMAE